MNKIAMIAAAGRGSRMLSLTENNPKAMLPFNGKPIIGHQLDYLSSQGFKEVVIIVGYQKDKLVDYVNKFYGDKLNIRFAEQKELVGLAGAINDGVKILTEQEKDEASLFIMLGDIVLNNQSLNYEYDFIGYDIVDDWSRWCMVDVKAHIVKGFYDKPDEKPETNKNIMGVYYLSKIKIFESILNEVIANGKKIRNEFQLSQALEKYIEHVTVLGTYIPDYYDLGELAALNNTRKNIARYFNSIETTDDNTIIKRSDNTAKMANEVNWYKSIDMNLKLYTPQLVNEFHGGYELEFIHSTPIQELYLFNLPEKHEWKRIFEVISRYLTKCMLTPNSNFSLADDNYDMLVTKTRDRVEQVKDYDFAKDEFITINNIVYKNPIIHLEKIISEIQSNFLENTQQYYSALHGDLFFGNMLYDVSTNSLKIIDPRGEYGKYSTRGDIRYDVAKLNHSVNGYYDFIVNGLYFLEERNNKFYYQFYESKQNEVQNIFKEIVLKDFDERQINLLTGILFLTMIPLHKENPKNQKMQFIKAVEFLQEFI
jgi:NDP-sugar pyrophosphorylase family protein